MKYLGLWCLCCQPFCIPLFLFFFAPLFFVSSSLFIPDLRVSSFPEINLIAQKKANGSGETGDVDRLAGARSAGRRVGGRAGGGIWTPIN